MTAALFAGSALSFSGHASQKHVELLTKQERKVAVNAMNLACMDTWCEGNTSIRFHEIRCDRDTSECVVDYSYRPEGWIFFKKKGRCTLRDIRSMDDLVPKINGEYTELDGKGYDQLNECMAPIS